MRQHAPDQSVEVDPTFCEPRVTPSSIGGPLRLRTTTHEPHLHPMPTDAGATQCAHCRQPLADAQAFCSHCGASVNRRDTAGDSLADRPQALLGSDVIVESEIGRGAMGVVFAGFDVALQRRVAIKTLLPSAEGESDVAARFIREARVAAALEHPHVVGIYSVRQADGIRAIVMRRVEGRSLHAVIEEGPRLPVPVTAIILAQVASALQHAHARGIVHRDIKPANVLLDNDGNAVVTDFGIARKLDSTRITEEGHIVGTIAYLSPEVGSGRDATPLSDQYSLGVMGFEMLAGRRPFLGTGADLLRQHVYGERPSLAALRPDLPDAVASCVQRMLSRDPAHRWQNLSGAERIFRDLVTDAPGVTRQVSGLSAVRSARTAPRINAARTMAARSAVVPATRDSARAVDAPRGPVEPTSARRAVRVTMGVLGAIVLGVVGAVTIARDPAVTAGTRPNSSDAPAAETPTPIVPAPRAPATNTVATQPPPPNASQPTESQLSPATVQDSGQAATDSARTIADSAGAAARPIARADKPGPSVLPPVERRDSAVPPAGPPSSPTDARRVGNAFITLINQGRWRELDALTRIGGDSAARDALVRAVRTTRSVAAGFDRLPSAPVPVGESFETEFVVDVTAGADPRAPHSFVVVTARAVFGPDGWVLAGWRVEPAP